MSDSIEARVEALEAEVKRLREMVESIKIGDVDGDLSIAFNGAVEGLSLFVGDVGADAVASVSGNLNGLSISAGDVGADLAAVAAGPMNGVSVTAGDVGGDVICQPDSDVHVGAGEDEG